MISQAVSLAARMSLITVLKLYRCHFSHLHDPYSIREHSGSLNLFVDPPTLLPPTSTVTKCIQSYTPMKVLVCYNFRAWSLSSRLSKMATQSPVLVSVSTEQQQKQSSDLRPQSMLDTNLGEELKPRMPFPPALFLPRATQTFLQPTPPKKTDRHIIIRFRLGYPDTSLNSPNTFVWGRLYR